MINEIKKPIVKDLKPKTNTHIQGIPLEKYVPGEPLKKNMKNQTKESTNLSKFDITSGSILDVLLKIVFLTTELLVSAAAIKYLFFK